MRIISKYLWGSFFLLSAMLLIAWWALHQSGTSLPAKVLQQMSEQVNISPPTVELPAISLPKAADLLPQSRTFYRWTDKSGNTGYSHHLPDDVSEFKAIVLHGEENVLTAAQK